MEGRVVRGGGSYTVTPAIVTRRRILAKPWGGGGLSCLCEDLLVNDKDGHEEAPTSQAAKSQRHQYHRRIPQVLEIVGLPWDVGAHEVARIHKCVYTKAVFLNLFCLATQNVGL